MCSRTVNPITTTFQTSIRSWRMKEVLSHLQLHRSRVGLWHLLEQMKSKRPCTPAQARSNCCVVGDCGCVEPASGLKGSNEIYGWQVGQSLAASPAPSWIFLAPSWRHALQQLLGLGCPSGNCQGTYGCIEVHNIWTHLAVNKSNCTYSAMLLTISSFNIN